MLWLSLQYELCLHMNNFAGPTQTQDDFFSLLGGLETTPSCDKDCYDCEEGDNRMEGMGVSEMPLLPSDLVCPSHPAKTLDALPF